jgi:hypothetical protein
MKSSFFGRKGTDLRDQKGYVKDVSPELGSALVRVAHKLGSNQSKSQIVKIEGKFYRVKELG